MRFDQIMEKIEVNHIDDMSIYQSLIFNIDEEERIEYQYGHKFWRRHDNLHRADGPTIEWADGTKEWWINGKENK